MKMMNSLGNMNIEKNGLELFIDTLIELKNMEKIIKNLENDKKNNDKKNNLLTDDNNENR